MLKLGILNQTDETIPLPNKKEAFLYSFNADSYNEMKEKGFRLEF
jgi:8-oxo-dGTP diphosphatase